MCENATEYLALLGTFVLREIFGQAPKCQGSEIADRGQKRVRTLFTTPFSAGTRGHMV